MNTFGALNKEVEKVFTSLLDEDDAADDENKDFSHSLTRTKSGTAIREKPGLKKKKSLMMIGPKKELVQVVLSGLDSFVDRHADLETVGSDGLLVEGKYPRETASTLDHSKGSPPGTRKKGHAFWNQWKENPREMKHKNQSGPQLFIPRICQLYQCNNYARRT